MEISTSQKESLISAINFRLGLRQWVLQVSLLCVENLSIDVSAIIHDALLQISQVLRAQGLEIQYQENACQICRSCGEICILASSSGLDLQTSKGSKHCSYNLRMHLLKCTLPLLLPLRRHDIVYTSWVDRRDLHDVIRFDFIKTFKADQVLWHSSGVQVSTQFYI